MLGSKQRGHYNNPRVRYRRINRTAGLLRITLTNRPSGSRKSPATDQAKATPHS